MGNVQYLGVIPTSVWSLLCLSAGIEPELWNELAGGLDALEEPANFDT